MRKVWGFSYMTFGAILAKLACNTGKAERVNMKKKELLNRIEELENENARLKSQIEYLKTINKPAIIYTPYTTFPIPPKPYEITWTCTSTSCQK